MDASKAELLAAVKFFVRFDDHAAPNDCCEGDCDEALEMFRTGLRLGRAAIAKAQGVQS